MLRTNSTAHGTTICADAFSQECDEYIAANFPRFRLTICDPPYGGIVDDEDWSDVDKYRDWMELCHRHSNEDGATIAMWGGTGKPGNRPFIEFAFKVEGWFPEWTILNWITWGKKRAYVVQDNYLYTREECLILTRGSPTFHIPLLDTKRGYAGYNEDYPAKSEYLRRTNVWTDINELFRDKIHQCQKPDKLYEVLINAHSDQGNTIFDPCAGSCTTARAAVNTLRKYVVIEQNLSAIQKAGLL